LCDEVDIIILYNTNQSLSVHSPLSVFGIRPYKNLAVSMICADIFTCKCTHTKMH